MKSYMAESVIGEMLKGEKDFQKDFMINYLEAEDQIVSNEKAMLEVVELHLMIRNLLWVIAYDKIKFRTTKKITSLHEKAVGLIGHLGTPICVNRAFDASKTFPLTKILV